MNVYLVSVRVGPSDKVPIEQYVVFAPSPERAAQYQTKFGSPSIERIFPGKEQVILRCPDER